MVIRMNVILYSIEYQAYCTELALLGHCCPLIPNPMTLLQVGPLGPEQLESKFQTDRNCHELL